MMNDYEAYRVVSAIEEIILICKNNQTCVGCPCGDGVECFFRIEPYRWEYDKLIKNH